MVGEVLPLTLGQSMVAVTALPVALKAWEEVSEAVAPSMGFPAASQTLTFTLEAAVVLREKRKLICAWLAIHTTANRNRSLTRLDDVRIFFIY